jgi:hypothetical protein
MTEPGDRPADIAAQLRKLEESLLDPAVRRSREQLRALLDADFLEFGSSGRTWTRNTIIELLQLEQKFLPPEIEDFRCVLLSDDVAMLTYRTGRTDPDTGERVASLRSSVWTRKSGDWRMRFHQGTRTVG